MKKLFLFLISTLSVYAADIDPMLIGGSPADPKEWPASVYASMGNSRCSATVIGEQALLIAAHCAGNGETATFSVGPNRYASKCTRSPWYPSNATSDWSLCKVSKKVTGIKYENVNQNDSLFAKGDELTLTGYGCIKPGGGGGNDGTYRVGKAKIQKMPSGTDNDIVTASGAAICFGDSGGPAFFGLGNSRVVVSVNSRGDISTTSYLVATHTPQFKQFSSDWIKANNLEICGITDGAKDCLNAIPPPPPPPPGKDFAIDSAVALVKGTVRPEYLRFYDNIVKVIFQFLESFK